MAENKLYHTTKKRTLLSNYSYPESNSDLIKPIGLWYSIDIDWLQWCDRNEYAAIHKYTHEIEIINRKRIFCIDSETKFNQFISVFKLSTLGGLWPLKGMINWERFQKVYDGIEIPDYYKFYDKRPDIMMWFNAWDCSSGCIWNLNNVKFGKRNLTKDVFKPSYSGIFKNLN